MKPYVYPCIFLGWILCCFFSVSTTLSEAAEILSPVEQQGMSTVLEELSAQVHNNGKYIEVTGAIKNISNSILKGFVTVYLLDASGGVITAQDESVGHGMEFRQGVVAKFAMALSVPKGKTIHTVSVDFTKE